MRLNSYLFLFWELFFDVVLFLWEKEPVLSLFFPFLILSTLLKRRQFHGN